MTCRQVACNRKKKRQKKAEHSKIALHPGPDQEPANTNAKQEHPARKCKKAQSHWTQFTYGVGKRHFLLGRFRMYLP